MKSPELDPTQASSYELGWTFNPITGCLNGCEYCYARKLANTRLKERYLANKNFATPDGSNVSPAKAYEIVNDPFYPRFWEDRQGEIMGVKDGKGIFVCDMSDLFGIGIPEEWIRTILRHISMRQGLRFYLLTKQPQNLIKWSPFPSNCYVGVSCSDEIMLTNAYAPFKQVDAKVKFISFEPLLNSDMSVVDLEWTLRDIGIKWVIIGAQTKPTIMPKKLWVEEITEACKKASIPYFLKDNLRPLMGDILQSSGKNVPSFTALD